MTTTPAYLQAFRATAEHGFRNNLSLMVGTVAVGMTTMHEAPQFFDMEALGIMWVGIPAACRALEARKAWQHHQDEEQPAANQ